MSKSKRAPGSLQSIKPMVIHVDRREQLPYDFENVRNVVEFKTQPATLTTGDYRVDRMRAQNFVTHRDLKHPSQIVVERKSLADLYQTLGKRRAAFHKEFERMAQYGFAALVIEAEWSRILCANRHLVHPTKIGAKVVLATLFAWSERYGVHVVPCPSREAAEVFTFRLLERWWRDVYDASSK